ncbi:3-oxoacyl-ACP reductase FabG [Glaciimonas sp. GNP009]
MTLAIVNNENGKADNGKADNLSKSVLVTGSSRGIGKAIALRLAREGYDIVLHCHRQRDAAEAVAALIRAMGRQARVLQCDIGDRQRTSDILLADIAEHGCYYGVVCNAGVARDNAFPAMSGEDWDLVLKTNLDGFYNVLNPLLMPMVHRRAPGRIVTLASVSGLIGNRGQVNYSAAKAGIIGATKALAIELAKRHITVNCVAPGLIETDMIADVPLEEALKMIPARRVGKPEEVAATVCFLMGTDAAYITRQVISVNGGMA